MTRGNPTSNWFDCAGPGSDLLRCVKKHDSEWLWLAPIVSLFSCCSNQNITSTCLSRCPCCLGCSWITAIWKVMLLKSLICLGKTFPFPQPLLPLRDTCKHRIHVTYRSWPTVYHIIITSVNWLEQSLNTITVKWMQKMWQINSKRGNVCWLLMR